MKRPAHLGSARPAGTSPGRREEGMAMVTVVFLGLVLMLLTAGVSARAMRQTGNTRSDAQWEQALQVAESGLDHGLALLSMEEAALDEERLLRAWGSKALGGTKAAITFP